MTPYSSAGFQYLSEYFHRALKEAPAIVIRTPGTHRHGRRVSALA
jgi:hypothetical protein